LVFKIAKCAPEARSRGLEKGKKTHGVGGKKGRRESFFRGNPSFVMNRSEKKGSGPYSTVLEKSNSKPGELTRFNGEEKEPSPPRPPLPCQGGSERECRECARDGGGRAANEREKKKRARRVTKRVKLFVLWALKAPRKETFHSGNERGKRGGGGGGGERKGDQLFLGKKKKIHSSSPPL